MDVLNAADEVLPRPPAGMERPLFFMWILSFRAWRE
uniref:Uncharacterized protein n=1 Tax=Nelumbo nucifera TaxID=4432 RepID=A0A822Y8F2_NELNU|nr:TPA_asm: hypothetical protein HUJ06_028944 [Nelumbo nucifera]